MKAHMLITTRLIVQAAGVYRFKFLFKCSWGLLLNGSIESGVECTPVAFPHSFSRATFPNEKSSTGLADSSVSNTKGRGGFTRQQSPLQHVDQY